MSTRAGIIIKNEYEEIHFYRHCDGYPKGIMPSLNKFLSWVKSGAIRNNPGQCAGWLVLIGAAEYGMKLQYKMVNDFGQIESIEQPTDWQVGSFWPTSNVHKHGDLRYIYTIDLDKKKITTKKL